MKKICVLLLVLALIIISPASIFAETPELPENNKLLSNAWVKGLGSAKAEKSTVDGFEVYTISKMNSTYASPYLDLYPTLKEMIGDEDEITVWIVFDVRVVNTADNEGAEFPFGMKLRPKTTSLTATEDAFADNYGGESDTFRHQYGSVSASLISNLSATEEWTRVEIMKTFIDFDFDDKFWTQWNLCFDMMSDYENGASLQVRNVGVYFEDDYESVEYEEEEEENNAPITNTPAPIDVYKPIGFDKYEITFTEALDSEQKSENATETTDSKATATPADNGGAVTEPALPIVLIAAGAAVVVIAVVAVIIIKKKGNKEEK